MSQPMRGESCWIATAPPISFPPLSGDLDVDVAIVGGGMVGITTARLLKDAGFGVAVVEARRVGRDVTGKSTAKITSQHNLIYKTLASGFGEDGARLYGEANQAGLRTILDLASRHGIDCDVETKAAYIYTGEEKHVGAIEEEAEIACRIGLPASVVRETSLPFDVRAALRFDDQAQFHPVKYVAGLARTIPGDGCHVFEDSRVTEWETDRIVTAAGSVRARHVVMATHLPLGKIGGLFAEVYPHMHPVIAGSVDPGRAPDGMFLGLDQPRHSIRTHRAGDGGMLLILAGATFKHGHVDEERTNFRDLERFAAEHFGVQADYRWTNEDYRSMDHAPFVGRSSSSADSYLVATGFNAWGISNGAAAAAILTDLIAGRDSPWLSVYDATRIKPVASAKQFAKGTAETAKRLVGDWVAPKPDSFAALARGEAAILDIDGSATAAFRDEQGELHAVSAVCTHIGCLVGWNETDRTWDCPCHGSRFDLAGEVIHGPAVAPLEQKTLAKAEREMPADH